ncbi:MAG: 3-deoxy-8-phosphooctulonate synthase [Acidobacteria bacterium]|nr:3-deoxy-8-phosphooctulonate synthase [Acidobacteriota bacterium]
MKTITLGPHRLGAPESLFFIAGPCVIESAEHTLRLAAALRSLFTEVNRVFIFKASFDKANRSSLQSYRGPGLVEGLRILADVKRAYGCPVLTDVHECAQVGPAADVADILQIPAFLCRQTDLLVEAGRSGRIVNVKKGQFMAPWDMSNVIAKIESTGNSNIILTERGFSFGYNNLVVDMRNLAIMREFGHPVVFDATHSVQLPGGAGTCSGGNAEFIAPLSRAAAACGVDGLFFEVHDDPSRALCDGPNAFPLVEFAAHVRRLLAIHAAAHGGNAHES